MADTVHDHLCVRDLSDLRKPALDLSDVVRERCAFNTGASLRTHWRHGRGVCSATPSGQAPTPHDGALKARGLTAKARTERSSMASRCALSSDTVREIKYQILHLILELDLYRCVGCELRADFRHTLGEVFFERFHRLGILLVSLGLGAHRICGTVTPTSSSHRI